MSKKSAGLLLFRERTEGVEVLLVHPGGPFWAKKDAGAWSIPKGEYDEGDDPRAAALREFEEETGTRVAAKPVPLARVRQSGGKWVEAFAAEGDLDCATIRSNHFELEWPPKSGRLQAFPEVAEARWMDLATAREFMLPSQLPLLDALEAKLEGDR